MKGAVKMMSALKTRELSVVLCLAVATALVGCASDPGSLDEAASLQQAQEQQQVKGEPGVCPAPDPKTIPNDEAVARMMELESERTLAVAALRFAGVEIDLSQGIGDYPGTAASAAWALCTDSKGAVLEILSLYAADGADSSSGAFKVIDGACNLLATGSYTKDVATLTIDLGVAAGLRCPKAAGLAYAAAGHIVVTVTRDEKNVLVTTLAQSNITVTGSYVTSTFGTARATFSATVLAGTTKVASYALPTLACEGRTGPLCGQTNVISVDSMAHDAMIKQAVAERGPLGYITAGLSDEGIARAASAAWNHARKIQDPSWAGVANLGEGYADWDSVDAIKADIAGRVFDTAQNRAVRCALMSDLDCE
jgi:hypothetical protein